MSIRKIVSAGVTTFRELADQSLELLLLRYSSYYGHPMGRVEKGEKLRQTAMRELKEETGLDLKEISSSPVCTINYRYVTHGIPIDKTVHFFAGLIYPNQIVRLSYEHSEFRWVNWRKGLQLLKYENAKTATLAGYEWIRKFH